MDTIVFRSKSLFLGFACVFTMAVATPTAFNAWQRFHLFATLTATLLGLLTASTCWLKPMAWRV